MKKSCTIGGFTIIDSCFVTLFAYGALFRVRPAPWQNFAMTLQTHFDSKAAVCWFILIKLVGVLTLVKSVGIPQAGQRVDARNSKGEIALHQAARSHCVPIVEALCRRQVLIPHALCYA